MIRFQCIHHGAKTQNRHQLEDKTERDSENKIVSKRQREGTYVKQKDCKWAAYCSYKDIGKRGSGIKGYVLVVKELAHSHNLIDNPLMYH